MICIPRKLWNSIEIVMGKFGEFLNGLGTMGTMFGNRAKYYVGCKTSRGSK